MPDPAELDKVVEQLIEMARADQQERSHFGEPEAEPWHDEERTARLIAIVDEHGWPTPDLVGIEAATAAWLIAQHSDADPGFQQRALTLMTDGADYPGKGEHLALLTDRVATNTGQPQVYGSQIGCYGDQPIPNPDVEQPDRVDELRADVGLEPLADYLSHLDGHCQNQAQIPADAGCRSITGATLLLGPNPVILVGHVPGTNEGPAFVEALTCIVLSYGLEATVGLQIPNSESDGVDSFLLSDGEARARDELLTGPFWASEVPDGRQSAAMFELLEALRRHIDRGAQIDVVLLDGTPAINRDATMASRLLDAIEDSSDRVAIVLTGNVHSSVALGADLDPSHEPMGYLIEQAAVDRTVVAIDMRYSNGSAWVCRDGGCGPVALAGNATNSPQLGDAVAIVDLVAGPAAHGFHGTYYVGDLSPAEPATEAIRNSDHRR